MPDYCPAPIGAEIAHIVRSASATRTGRRLRPRPTGSKVHRGSGMYVGEEGNYPRPISRQWGERLWWLARRFDDRGRIANKVDKPGSRDGPLGAAALDVLRVLLDTIDRRTGMLYPAIVTIAARCGRAVQTVVAALRRLADHGFLEWQRRVEPTGAQGLRGPQVRQASNLYRFKVPPELVSELAPPQPEDDAWRRQEAREAAGRMADDEEAILAAMRPVEAANAIIGRGCEDPLGRALSKLGRTLEEQAKRDSNGRDESPRKLYL